MTRNEVLEKILFIITEKLHIDTGVICEDTLLQDIGVDSITPVSYTHLTLPTKLEV